MVLEIAGASALEHRDSESRTPLIMATIGGHGELVNFLLSQGGIIMYNNDVIKVRCVSWGLLGV